MPIKVCRRVVGSAGGAGGIARLGVGEAAAGAEAHVGTEMVRALQRVDNLAGFGLGRVAVSKVPVRRMKTLAKYGAGTKAPALDRLVEPRRTATLLAVTRSLEAEAIDDALDLFALLMATRLISPARRRSADERLRMLPRLERASKLVAKAGRVLVDHLDLVDQQGADPDVAAMWTAVAQIAGTSKEHVRAALDVVEELIPEEDGAAEAAPPTPRPGNPLKNLHDQERPHSLRPRSFSAPTVVRWFLTPEAADHFPTIKDAVASPNLSDPASRGPACG
nr:hypothetical protein [Nonomuraea fuscirosea]